MSSAATIHVLCVDDEPDLASLVARFLTENSEDITADYVTSGAEALEHLSETKPDCIVCDYDMPGKDGLEVLSMIREDMPDIPFILFTGQGNEDVAAEAVRAGVSDYIPKTTGTEQYELLANRVRNTVERHRARTSMRAVFNAATDAILVHEMESGEIIDVNDAAVKLWGRDAGELIGKNPSDLIIDSDEPTGWLPVDETRTTPRDWKCNRPDGAHFWAEIRVQPATIDGQERLLSIARDITNRKQREQQLSRLLTGAESLLTTRELSDVSQVITDLMTEELGFKGANVFVRENLDTFSLKEAASSGELTISIDTTLLEAQLSDVVRTDGGTQLQLGDPTSTDGVWSWPLDHYGILIAEHPETVKFDNFTQDLLSLHLAIAKAALTRAYQERQLAEQHSELKALNHMNELIRDINQTLVIVSTRDEIEHVVCKQLAAASPFVSAWIGEQDLTNREVTVRVAVGRGANELRDISIATDDEDSEDPLTTVIRSVIDDFEVALIDEMTPEKIGEFHANAAAEHGFESITIIPITYQNALYDLLAIYAEEPHPLGPEQKAVLKELGETIGYAMHTAERSRALLSDTRVELEYHVRDNDSIVFGLSDALGTAVELERIFFRPDDSARLFLSVANTNVAAIREALEELQDGTVDVREISHRGDGTIIEVNVETVGLMRHLSEAMATIRSATAENGEGRLVIEVPNTVSVRTLTDNLAEVFDDLSLLARRQRDVDDGELAELESSTDMGLTDRQHEVLLTAYHAGFFSWPRESTGEEIAELLDISQPTFHEHLRTGERKLLDLLFEHRRSVYT